MLLTWLAAHGSLKGQDLVFSQFYNAPIQLNPGLVGLSNNGQLHLNYRNQWPTWPLVYQSFNVSYDKYFNELNSGFGAQISVDDQGGGIIKTNSVTGVYAYQINLGKKLQARVGLEAGFIQTTLNWDKLIFGDQIVPEALMVNRLEHFCLLEKFPQLIFQRSKWTSPSEGFYIAKNTT